MPRRATGRALPRTAVGDDELVLACLAGEERAWRELVERYGRYIHAVAARAFALDPAAADEVFADVCVRVYDGLAGYAARGEFRSWLRAVTVSACQDYLRRESRHAERAREEIVPTQQIEELEASLDVRIAVETLGEPCRTTIDLYFFRGLTQAQVARALGVPPGTVAARLSRCLRRLREVLQDSDPPAASRRRR